MHSKEIADSIGIFMSKRINKDCYHFNNEKGVFSYNFTDGFSKFTDLSI